MSFGSISRQLFNLIIILLISYAHTLALKNLELRESLWVFYRKHIKGPTSDLLTNTSKPVFI